MSAPSSPQEWLILQCQVCRSPMKVRPQMAAGVRVSCPVCSSPLLLDQSNDVRSPEFRGDPPQADPRQQGGQARPATTEEYPPDPEFSPGVSLPAEFNGARPDSDDGFLQNLKSTVERHGRRQVKVKKRRKQGPGSSPNDVLMDWDSVMDKLPEAELYSDPWLKPMPIPEEVIQKNAARDFVVSEESEDGQTVRMVKRVRKRRIFSLAQLFFRRLSYGMRVLTVGLVTVIGVSGVWWGIKVFRQRFMPVTFADVVDDLQLDQAILERQNEDASVKVVTEYLAAVGAEAKLARVRLPDRVRPLMETWYRKHPDKPVVPEEVLSRDKFTVGSTYFVKLEMLVTAPDPLDATQTKSEKRFFIIEEKAEKDGGRSYRVDWETSSGWCEMTFDEFKLQQPRTPVPFRLKIRGSDYYNHGFTDEKKWVAAELYYPHPEGDKERIFFGYLERGTQAWRDLAIFTEPGNNASVIVSLRYPADAISREQVIIDSMVHDSWLYTDESPTARKRPGGPR